MGCVRGGRDGGHGAGLPPITQGFTSQSQEAEGSLAKPSALETSRLLLLTAVTVPGCPICPRSPQELGREASSSGNHAEQRTLQKSLEHGFPPALFQESLELI